MHPEVVAAPEIAVAVAALWAHLRGLVSLPVLVAILVMISLVGVRLRLLWQWRREEDRWERLADSDRRWNRSDW